MNHTFFNGHSHYKQTDSPPIVVDNPINNIPPPPLNAPVENALTAVVIDQPPIPSAETTSVPVVAHQQLDENILAYIDQSLRKFKEVGYLNNASQSNTGSAGLADRYGDSFNELHDMHETQRLSPFFDSASSMDRVISRTDKMITQSLQNILPLIRRFHPTTRLITNRSCIILIIHIINCSRNS